MSKKLRLNFRKKLFRVFKDKGNIAAELFNFLWERKLWWLIPAVIMLLVMGILIMLIKTAIVTPFMYPLF